MPTKKKINKNDNGKKESGKKETNKQQSLIPKKIRLHDPDVTVLVGIGDGMKTYKCYSQVLCHASPYLDAILSKSGMLEGKESTIKFPNKKAEEWELVHSFIDPRTVRHASITEDNIDVLCGWFHEFQMEDLLGECDKFAKNLFLADFEYTPRLANDHKVHLKNKTLSVLNTSDHWNLLVTKQAVLSKVNVMLANDLDIFELEDIMQLSIYLKEQPQPGQQQQPPPPPPEQQQQQQQPEEDEVKRLREIFNLYLPEGMHITDDTVTVLTENPMFPHLVFAEMKAQRVQAMMAEFMSHQQPSS